MAPATQTRRNRGHQSPELQALIDAEQVETQKSTAERDQFVRDYAGGKPIDGLLAKSIQERYGMSAEELAKILAEAKTQASLLKAYLKAAPLHDELSADRAELADAEKELADVSAPIVERIDSLKSRVHRLSQEYSRAKNLKDTLIKRAPDFVTAELANVANRIRRVSNSIRHVPTLVRGTHVDRHNDKDGYNYDERLELGTYEEQHERKLADYNANLPAWQDELEVLKVRKSRLEELAMQPWPTSADVDAINALEREEQQAARSAFHDDEENADSE